MHVVGAVSRTKKEGALRVRRQREDGSSLGNLHDGLTEAAPIPGSCTSTRAVGCSLRGSAQILYLLVERCVRLKSVRVVMLDYGENVQGDPPSERERQLVDCRQARQQHWRHKGVTEQKQRSVVGDVLVIIGRGVITAGEHGEPKEVLTLNFAPHRTFGVEWVTPAVHVPFASPFHSGARGATSTWWPGGRRTGISSHDARLGQSAPRLDTASGRGRGAGAAVGAGELLTDRPVGPR